MTGGGVDSVAADDFVDPVAESGDARVDAI